MATKADTKKVKETKEAMAKTPAQLPKGVRINFGDQQEPIKSETKQGE